MSDRAFQINSSCTSCGNCIQVCPTESIFFSMKQFLIDSDTCDGSAVCVAVCPVDAIHALRSGEAGKTPDPLDAGSKPR